MLNAWFKGCLVEILALRDYLACFKKALNVVLWLGCGRFRGPVCEVSMACSKHGLRAVWLKSLPLGTIWTMLKRH